MESGAPPGQSGGMGNCYVFKSRLQEYAQKAGFNTPEYDTVKEGPSHDPIFRSTVVVNNVKYDSLPGFGTRKAAEQSAAEVALLEILKSGQMTEHLPAVHETGLCKNMLQEYAQKMNYAIPSYICTKRTVGYICTIEIGGIQYIGAAAKTRKEAEIKAARTAFIAIQIQGNAKNGTSQYTVLPTKKEVQEQEKQPTTAETKKLKPRRKSWKKKWNKKFPKRHGCRDRVTRDDATGDNATAGVVAMSETVEFDKDEFRKSCSDRNQVGANCAGFDQIRSVSGGENTCGG